MALFAAVDVTAVSGVSKSPTLPDGVLAPLRWQHSEYFMHTYERKLHLDLI